MASTEQPTNLQKLMQAEIINPHYAFSDLDKELIETLSTAEVDSLIAIKTKLGKDFFLQHGGGPTAGILF